MHHTYAHIHTTFALLWKKYINKQTPHLFLFVRNAFLMNVVRTECLRDDWTWIDLLLPNEPNTALFTRIHALFYITGSVRTKPKERSLHLRHSHPMNRENLTNGRKGRKKTDQRDRKNDIRNDREFISTSRTPEKYRTGCLNACVQVLNCAILWSFNTQTREQQRGPSTGVWLFIRFHNDRC